MICRRGRASPTSYFVPYFVPYVRSTSNFSEGAPDIAEMWAVKRVPKYFTISGYNPLLAGLDPFQTAQPRSGPSPFPHYVASPARLA